MNDLTRFGGWALITGASSGIGAEFARAVAAQNVNCLLVARRLERLESLAEQLRDQFHVDCRTLAQDLTAADAAEQIKEKAAGVPVGILINNAGFGYRGRFETRDPGRLAQLVNLNCLAPVLLTRAFLPQMVERGHGALVFVSSVVGILPAPFDSVYGASKAFDLHLGEGLWAELKGSGVDVVTVCPSITKTEFWDVEGMDDAAKERALKTADSAQAIVALTLRALGKKPSVAPWSTRFPAFLSRFVPRKQTVAIAASVMRKLHQDALGSK